MKHSPIYSASQSPETKESAETLQHFSTDSSTNPWQSAKDAIASLIEARKEQGVQVAVYHQGHLVIDFASGYLDSERTRPVTPRSLFPVFSVTKGITSTLVHILAERGDLSYDMLLSDVWPEFSGHGKERITLAQVLGHSSGLHMMPQGLNRRILTDWRKMCEAIAMQAPLYPPGTETDYHPITFSWLVGETLQRVTGKPFEQILQEEIRAPLGIEDLYVGLPDGLDSRVATMLDLHDPPATPVTEPAPVPPWMKPLGLIPNHLEFRQACLPGVSGIMSARAIARHYAALLPEGIEGLRLLSPARVQAATVRQYPTLPQPPGQRPRGLGYQLGTPTDAMGSDRAFGHDGHGGAIGYADTALGIAVGITRSTLNTAPLALEISTIIRNACPPA